MILADVPWGLTSREFILLCLGLSGIFMGSLVTILWVAITSWRDRGIAKFTDQTAEKQVRAESLHAESIRARYALATGQRLGRKGGSQPPHSSPFMSDGRVAPPAVGRSDPPTPKSASAHTPVERRSAAADRTADRTRLDMNPFDPTEER